LFSFAKQFNDQIKMKIRNIEKERRASGCYMQTSNTVYRFLLLFNFEISKIEMSQLSRKTTIASIINDVYNIYCENVEIIYLEVIELARVE
jgi:hypothetical protein